MPAKYGIVLQLVPLAEEISGQAALGRSNKIKRLKARPQVDATTRKPLHCATSVTGVSAASTIV